MTLQEFEFPREWYEDEVRDGVFVSNTMKRNWAGQLMVLREIGRVCAELNLTWYLDGGSLLGAVRHKGFIPWDDDMDITMLRKDIEIFRQKAYSLLPDGYFILDPRDEEEVDVDVFRVVATKTLNLSSEYMNHYHCPFIMGIDIFPLDNCSDDDAYENNRYNLMLSLKTCLSHIKEEGDPELPGFKKLISYCNEETGIDILKEKDPIHTINVEMVKLYAEHTDDTTKKVKIFFGNRSPEFEREWFGTPKMLSFEGIELPAPCAYEKVLFSEYGNQKYIGRGGGAHDFPYYESHEKVFKDAMGHYPFRYTFDPNDLSDCRTESPRELTDKMISMLDKLQAVVRLSESDTATRTQLLMSEQKILSSLSGVLVPLFPDGAEKLIEAMRLFGEVIFDSSSDWKSDSCEKLDESFHAVKAECKQALLQRKIIVFLPCRISWWSGMEKLWRYAKGLSDATVYVSPIAWYEENKIGEKGERHDETEDFPKEIGVIHRSDLDLKALHPEAIVIQVPFDNMCSYMMIDDENCSYQLKNMTDKLIYLPCFQPDTPGEEEKIAVKSMENLIEQPAVMYADEVRVSTSRMRDIYIDTLAEICGEDRRKYWEQKIKADDQTEITMKDTVFERVRT